jgi:Pao retrotransposon peptidase/Family of unknown function (DUF5641)/Protein of unknown function (DUF1759)/Putative peptidase (DUF1758)/Integrase zinc binding domain/Integrase core domain
MPNSDGAVRRRRMKNCLAEYEKQLTNISQLRTTFNAAEHDRFYLRRKVGAIDSLVEAFTTKAEELRNDAYEEEVELSQLSDRTFQFNELADLTVSILRRYIEQVTPQPEQPPPPPIKIRLPEISLVNFDGNPTEWFNYKESFCSLVKNNQDLDDVQRLLYLKKTLIGAATKVQSSVDTFESLWEAVCKRFELPRIIVNQHIEELLAFKPLREESAIDLRRLLDLVVKNLRALDKMDLVVDKLGEQIVIILVCGRLDDETRKALDCFLPTDELPKWEDVLNFLEKRCQTLESIVRLKGSSNKSSGSKTTPASRPKRTEALATTTENEDSSEATCPLCEKVHYLHRCSEFLKLSPEVRLIQVNRFNRCTNCLSPRHKVSECRSCACRHCKKKHHTLLHPGEPKSEDKTEPETEQPSTSASLASQVSTYNEKSHRILQKQVMLSTVVIIVYDFAGTPYHCRAVLDSASESNYITESFFQTLKLKKIPLSMIAGGLNGGTTPVRKAVTINLKSRVSAFSTSLDCLVVPKIIPRDLPAKALQIPDLKIPPKILLADPQFGTPQPVDLLIGAEWFYEIHLKNQLKLHERLPPFQETVFGWVVGGLMASKEPRTTTFCALSLPTNSDLQNELKRFWEIESCDGPRPMTPEERLVEKHFTDTVRRQPDGRYIVNLPVKPNISKLGESRLIALRRLYALERRFVKDPIIKEAYTEFIDEYKRLGHMAPSGQTTNNGGKEYFLPHHAVVKPDSSTTKLRVVFDGSAASSTGLSLNDCLRVGPTIQQDLLDIVLRFRKHRYAFTADVGKMYRQILVTDEQRPLQQILWRPNAESSVKAFSLKTVTYGTSSASYLAIRVLQQLADDESSEFPAAATVAKTDFYVDDCLSGAATLEEAQELQGQLIQLLQRGQLSLHKWCANVPDLLASIAPENQEKKLSIGCDGIKTLGLAWHPLQDKFIMSVNRPTSSIVFTKRSMSSDIARLFDPLGLVGPVIVEAKCQLQRLWELKIDWDDPIDGAEAKRWTAFREQLMNLRIEVDRCLLPWGECRAIELIGFCDSSTVAYGACLYIRCVLASGAVTTKLLCSKSKVAPLKTVTIPRLELCGALLLSRLVARVKRAMQINFDRTVLFCDSTIVLCWLRTTSTNLKIFVAHRVAEIQELTNLDDWRHVPTEQNPADLVSRGLMPDQLKMAELWWRGPEFLAQEVNSWPPGHVPVIPDELPETKSLVASTVVPDYPAILSDCSNYKKVLRVMAYVGRFLTNTRQSKATRTFGPLTGLEMVAGQKLIVRCVQGSHFPDDIKALSNGQAIANSSSLKKLNAFMDNERVLRVGGRLQHSTNSFEAKHQMLLPKDHPITTTLIRHCHQENGHCGPQALLAIIRQTFWPIGARGLVRSVTRGCVTCFKARPTALTPPMGDLPAVRVTQGHPFLNTGVDYAGPLTLKVTRRTSTKAYVAIFVCMATKAVHLEIVSDASTAAFIAALHRFVSRRGLCLNLYSDNGTNFVGAKTELKAIHDLLQDSQHQSAVADACASHQIQFHFIPPRAPHFGGLWEAAVKSMKYHLTRIVGMTHLYFEEMATVLCKIEAVLNSRPLVPASDDPNDLTALTPGHFLIGRPLVAVAEPNFIDVNTGHLRRWQVLQKMTQHFWRRWSVQYLNTLQQRPRSPATISRIKIGALVLIREDKLPPAQWILGRIIEVHPGEDEIVRVVTIRTPKTTLQRPAKRICVLPTEPDTGS